MPILLDHPSYTQRLLSEIGLVSQYLDDLLNLSAGIYPGWGDFAKAATVRNWRQTKLQVDAIAGEWSGFHGTWTSAPLQILSVSGGWARTEGGLLRLMEPRKE